MGINMVENHRVNYQRDSQQAVVRQADALERIAVALEQIVTMMAPQAGSAALPESEVPAIIMPPEEHDDAEGA
jgi:hypothetical protein